MSKIDLVLLHPPALYDFRQEPTMLGPVSDLIPSGPVFEFYPIGFTTISDYLERHGLKVRIINILISYYPIRATYPLKFGGMYKLV